MTVDTWLAAALKDAEARGLHELKPLLEGLAQATRALRAADFNDLVIEPAGDPGTPAARGTSGDSPNDRTR